MDRITKGRRPCTKCKYHAYKVCMFEDGKLDHCCYHEEAVLILCSSNRRHEAYCGKGGEWFKHVNAPEP